MNLRAARKDERIDIRLTEEEKRIIIRAHELSGASTFTSFVVDALKSKSEEIIERKERILATERDRETFFNAIFSDKKPNAALKKAMKEYQKFKSQFDIKED